MVYNGTNEEAVIELPEGSWVVLADKYETDCRKEPPLTAYRQLHVEAKSGMILARR